MSAALRLALRYAEAFGWRVIPLPPGKKGAPPQGWPERATTDADKIERWWSRDRGVGIVCGNGLVVIDVDVKGGRRGDLGLDVAQAQLGDLPPTLTVTTPSGGSHLYFRVPCEIRNAAGVWEGIDIRGDGGYVVAPPTELRNCDGVSGAYEWDHDDADLTADTLATLPAAWVDRLRGRVQSAKYALPEEVGEGQRNHEMFRFASSLRRTIDREDLILAACFAANAESFRPMLSDREVRDIVSKVVRRYTPDERAQRSVMASIPIPAPVTRDPRAVVSEWVSAPDLPIRARVALDGGAPDVIAALSDMWRDDAPAVEAALAPLSKKLRSQVLEVVSEASATEGRGRVRPHPHIPGVHVPDGYVIPEPWHVDEHGVWRVTAAVGDGEPKLTRVCPVPVIVSSRAVEVETDAYAVEIAWCLDGRGKTLTVDRNTAHQARRIADLASAGLPVTSATAAMLAQYLADVEAANHAVLSPSRVTERCGWVMDEDATGVRCPWFVLPAATYGAGGPVLAGAQAPRWGASAMSMGDVDQSITRYGTWEDWHDMATSLAHYPYVSLALAAALATPWLEVLDAPNFVLSYGSRSGSGKTSLSCIAASVWGVAAIESPRAYARTWEATGFGLERTATALSSLPLILDDTKRAIAGKRGDAGDVIAGILYALVSGQGKVRGTQGLALRKRSSSRTIVISTGEHSLYALCGQHQGAVARIVSVDVPPWGDTGPRTRAVVDCAREISYSTYGHAGPRAVREMLAAQDQWSEVRAEWHARRMEYAARAVTTDPLAGRVASYVAFLQVAGSWMLRAIGLGSVADAASEACAWIVDELRTVIPGRDIPAQALCDVLGWVVSDRLRFDAHSPHPQGLAGVWEEPSPPRFFPAELGRWLKTNNYSSGEVIGEWHARGWLDAEDGYTTRRMPVGSRRARMIVLSPRALEVAGLRASDGFDEASENPYG